MRLQIVIKLCGLGLRVSGRRRDTGIERIISMLRLWKLYRNCLATHPVQTQMISTGFIWGFGDVASQAVTHYTVRLRSNQALSHDKDKDLKIDWRQVAKTASLGFVFVGPVGHFWYEGLDRIVRVWLKLQPNSFRFVAAKVVTDDIIFRGLLVYFSSIWLFARKPSEQVKEDVKRHFLPALILEGGQVANFRFIPVRYQLQCVNLLYLLNSCFLSWLKQQEDAPWKFKSVLSFKEEGQGK